MPLDTNHVPLISLALFVSSYIIGGEKKKEKEKKVF